MNNPAHAVVLMAGLSILSPAAMAAPIDHSRCADPRVLHQLVGQPDHTVAAAAVSQPKIIRIKNLRHRFQVRCEPLAQVHDQCVGLAVMSDGRTGRIYFAVKRQSGRGARPDRVRFGISVAGSGENDQPCGDLR